MWKHASVSRQVDRKKESGTKNRKGKTPNLPLKEGDGSLAFEGTNAAVSLYTLLTVRYN